MSDQKLCARCEETAMWLHHQAGAQLLCYGPGDAIPERPHVGAIPEELDGMRTGRLPIRSYWSSISHVELPMRPTEPDGPGVPVCGISWHPHEGRGTALNW